MQNIEINDQFKTALDIIENTGANLFVTGKAGTGKSTLLEYFREHTEKKTAVLAPTGVAAVNIRGQTLHSFFGFRPDITVEKAKKAARKALKLGYAEIYNEIETLIIDEISMVRADVFDCADSYLKIARECESKPFGGVQVVMIGDLYQLSPVVTSHEREIFSGHYKSPYFFDSRVFAQMGAELLELEKVYRQHDGRFIELLNAVRNNTIDDAGVALINSRLVSLESFDSDGSIHLTSLNKEADAINEKKLAELPGKNCRFEAEIDGEFSEKSYPADAVIDLKEGAQVMLLNNDQSGRWVNGTIGTVESLDNRSAVVRLAGGATHEVRPYAWQMFSFKVDKRTRKIVSEPVGKFTQMPLMLAWAVTIHKSQGKTFDRAVIDVGRAFTAGQAYVALSRLRTFDGMALSKPFKKSQVRVDWRVVKFLTAHRYAESEKTLPVEKKTALIEDAISRGLKLEITYLKANDTKSRRVVRPIEVGEMFYSDKPFLGMKALCALRGEERTFRVDRVLEMKLVN